MWTFIIAGALYLIGVGVVLVVRPSSMFTPDGNWKEFGIGQREDRYTPFPFWLFCLVWALIAYVSVLLVYSYILPSEETIYENNLRTNRYKNKNINRRPKYQAPMLEDDMDVLEDGLEEAVELPKGYYVLNKKATKLSGVPKYVYLGPEEPTS